MYVYRYTCCWLVWLAWLEDAMYRLVPFEIHLSHFHSNFVTHDGMNRILAALELNENRIESE